jgi:hypothetical protein
MWPARDQLLDRDVTAELAIVGAGHAAQAARPCSPRMLAPWHRIRPLGIRQRHQPVLEGSLAAQARGVVDDIVEALDRQPPSALPGLQGDASTALLFAYYGRSTAGSWLDLALNTLAERASTVSLFSGISGLSWLLDQSDNAKTRSRSSHILTEPYCDTWARRTGWTVST